MKAKFNRKNQVIVLLDDSELTVLKRLIMVQDAESEEAEIRCLIWAKALELGVWGFEKEPLTDEQILRGEGMTLYDIFKGLEPSLNDATEDESFSKAAVAG